MDSQQEGGITPPIESIRVLMETLAALFAGICCIQDTPHNFHSLHRSRQLPSLDLRNLFEKELRVILMQGM